MLLKSAGLRLGVRLQARRRFSLLVFSLALSAPAILVNFAITADYLSKASDEQYVATVLGTKAVGQVRPSITVYGRSQAEFRKQVTTRDQTIKRLAPSSSLVIHVRDGSISFGDRQVWTSATGDSWANGRFDPSAFRVSSGSMPTESGTAALSTELSRQLGTKLGDEVIFSDQKFRVVGIAERALDRRRVEAYFRNNDLLAATDDTFEYSWKYFSVEETQNLVAWNQRAPIGESILVATRGDILNRLSSYAQKLPMPMVAGALAVLVCTSLLFRTLTRQQHEERLARLVRLGSNRRISILLSTGATVAVTVVSLVVTVLTSTFLVFILRQNVWLAGERIPGELELPTLTVALVWVVSVATMLTGMLLPFKTSTKSLNLESGGSSGRRALRQMAKSNSRFRAHKWSRVGAALALLTSSALLSFIDTSVYASNSLPSSLAPGQVRVLRNPIDDLSLGDTVVSQRPREVRAALTDSLGADFFGVSDVEVPSPSSVSEQNQRTLMVQSPENGSGLAYVESPQAAAALIGRQLTQSERQAFRVGSVIFVREVGFRPLTAASLSWYSFRKNVNLGSVDVFTDVHADVVYGDVNFIAGPAALKLEPFVGLDAYPRISFLLSGPSAIETVQDVETLQSTLAQFGIPASTVVKKESAVERSDGLMTLVVLMFSAAAGIALVELASRAVDAQPDEARLRRMYAPVVARFAFVFRHGITAHTAIAGVCLFGSVALGQIVVAAPSGAPVQALGAVTLIVSYVGFILVGSTVLSRKVR